MSLKVVRRLGRSQPPEWKIRFVKELAEELKKHPVIGIADLTGMPTAQLQLVRKRFRRTVSFKVVKKRLLLKALEEAGLKREKFEPFIKGTTLLMFTNINPFKLARSIESEKMPAPAKPGMVTEREIVIPEGDTGLQPGPILSTFGKLKIPYEIRRGTIYVKKDTVAAKPGDVIGEDLAGLLQTLGIMPFEVGLKVQAVYDRGIIIPREELIIDIEEFKRDIMVASKEVIGLAAETGLLIVPEATSLIIMRAALESLAIIRSTGLLLPGTVEEIVKVTALEALSVITSLGKKAKELGIEEIPMASSTVVTKETSEIKEEEERKETEEEKEEEVDIGEGLAGLFG